MSEKLEEKLQDHGTRLAVIENSHNEQMRKMESLINTLNDVAGTLKEFVVRHDMIKQDNDRMQKQLDEQSKTLKSIKETQTADKPVIDGLRAINGKIVWFILVALASPITAGLAMIYKG